MKLTNSEKLSYSTIRIECIYNNKNKGSGTGFFYYFDKLDENGVQIPVIITNKHVVENAVEVNLVFIRADEDGNPLDKEHFNVKLDLRFCFFHEEPSVDLCALLIGHMMNDVSKANIKLFFTPLNKSILPTNEQLDTLSPLEDVVMIGYPNGIWDSLNNKPIFRKGVSATHPNLDYNGKKEFLIDMACFPGSSGSPIFIYNEFAHKDRDGNTIMGSTRIILIGVLYSGPIMLNRGEVKVVEIPTVQKTISESSLMINLGNVIKSERILELEQQVNSAMEVLKT